MASLPAISAPPPVFPSLESLRAHVDEQWTNSVSAVTLPPGWPFQHDLGVLAYGATFPSAFLAACGAVTNEGVVMHEVTITESNDLQRVWRGPGVELGQFPVPAEYDAEAWVLEHFPPPAHLSATARANRIQDCKLGARQTLALRLIPEASIPAYQASLAARAAANPAQVGTNEIGAVSTRLLPGGQQVEVLVQAPPEVGSIGVYQTGELTSAPDWTFQGFALRLDSPVAFQLALPNNRAYVLFANHLWDSDGDRLPDAFEELITGTSATSADSDGDGLDDWEELSLVLTSALQADTDGDGLSDGNEIRLGLDPLFNGQSEPDPDGDGLSADLEALLGTNPLQYDSAPRLDL